LCCAAASAEVTKAVQARKQDKQRKAHQQLLEPRQGQGVASGAAAEEEDDDEAALDASLDQVIVTWIRLCLSRTLLNCFPMLPCTLSP
jgi:hypothetical protein